ncbi:MAG: homoserine kinase [Candidatus Melainabacteria bacterium]|nr:MAG: homoserine kinase [Candidatus Melainabacteria bacterium]
MKVSYRVPATTANLGPGFDCLGLALPIYNIITIEETVMPSTGIEVNVMKDFENAELIEELDSIPNDKDNIVYKAVEILYNLVGQDPSEIKINIKSSIPIAKGLGSSASVIVGGLMAANDLLGNPADEAALLSIATEAEGHPDNVVPAILGGLVMSSMEDDGSVIYRRLDWPEDWHITVCIPDFELATNISRSVLPEKVPMEDAKFNARRLAMLIHAIDTVDAKLMKSALEDRLHQPYREKLVPGFKEIKEALKHEENVLGTVISGAGPSIVIFSQKNNLEKIYQTVKEVWDNLNVHCDIRTLTVEKCGASKVE